MRAEKTGVVPSYATSICVLRSSSIHFGPSFPIGVSGSAGFSGCGAAGFPFVIVSTCPTSSMSGLLMLFCVMTAWTVVLNLKAIVERLSPRCTVYLTVSPGMGAAGVGTGVLVGFGVGVGGTGVLVACGAGGC